MTNFDKQNLFSKSIPGEPEKTSQLKIHSVKST